VVPIRLDRAPASQLLNVIRQLRSGAVQTADWEDEVGFVLEAAVDGAVSPPRG
jgi:hypothetical protein